MILMAQFRPAVDVFLVEFPHAFEFFFGAVAFGEEVGGGVGDAAGKGGRVGGAGGIGVVGGVVGDCEGCCEGRQEGEEGEEVHCCGGRLSCRRVGAVVDGCEKKEKKRNQIDVCVDFVGRGIFNYFQRLGEFVVIRKSLFGSPNFLPSNMIRT